MGFTTKIFLFSRINNLSAAMKACQQLAKHVSS
jgi:hypothetical protein